MKEQKHLIIVLSINIFFGILIILSHILWSGYTALKIFDYLLPSSIKQLLFHSWFVWLVLVFAGIGFYWSIVLYIWNILCIWLLNKTKHNFDKTMSKELLITDLSFSFFPVSIIARSIILIYRMKKEA